MAVESRLFGVFRYPVPSSGAVPAGGGEQCRLVAVGRADEGDGVADDALVGLADRRGPHGGVGPVGAHAAGFGTGAHDAEAYDLHSRAGLLPSRGDRSRTPRHPGPASADTCRTPVHTCRSGAEHRTRGPPVILASSTRGGGLAVEYVSFHLGRGLFRGRSTPRAPRTFKERSPCASPDTVNTDMVRAPSYQARTHRVWTAGPC